MARWPRCRAAAVVALLAVARAARPIDNKLTSDVEADHASASALQRSGGAAGVSDGEHVLRIGARGQLVAQRHGSRRAVRKHGECPSLCPQKDKLKGEEEVKIKGGRRVPCSDLQGVLSESPDEYCEDKWYAKHWATLQTSCCSGAGGESEGETQAEPEEPQEACALCSSAGDVLAEKPANQDGTCGEIAEAFSADPKTCLDMKAEPEAFEKLRKLCCRSQLEQPDSNATEPGESTSDDEEAGSPRAARTPAPEADDESGADSEALAKPTREPEAEPEEQAAGEDTESADGHAAAEPSESEEEDAQVPGSEELAAWKLPEELRAEPPVCSSPEIKQASRTVHKMKGWFSSESDTQKLKDEIAETCAKFGKMQKKALKLEARVEKAAAGKEEKMLAYVSDYETLWALEQQIAKEYADLTAREGQAKAKLEELKKSAPRGA